MKIIKLSFSLLAILLVIVLGCKKNNKDTVLNNPKSDKELIEIYSKAGEVHNRGLDHMYKFFKKIATQHEQTRNRSAGTQIEMLEVNEAVADYMKDSLGISGINFVKIYNGDTLLKNPGYSDISFSNHYFQLKRQHLSLPLSNALDQFELVFRDSIANRVSTNYDTILQNILPTISNETDKIAFIGCVFIARSSLEYWATNMGNWEALSNQLLGVAGKSITEQALIEMAYADASGAIVGVLSGAGIIGGGIVGTAILPGLGTLVGSSVGALAGMIGGALAGSTMSGIHSVIRWITGWY